MCVGKKNKVSRVCQTCVTEDERKKKGNEITALALLALASDFPFFVLIQKLSMGLLMCNR